MEALCILVLLALQDPPKQPQGRDEILKQDIENAIKKLASDRGNESFLARAELIDLGRRAVPAVVAELNKRELNKRDPKEAAVKRSLCEILGEVRDPNKEAVAALVAKLKDADEFGPSIASAAAGALASIGDDSCLPALLDILKSKGVETDKMLKYECIRAMGLFRAVESVDLLRKALEDKKPASASENDEGAPLIAAAAAEALGLIRAQGAADDLGKMLTESTPNPATQETLAVHAARALQRILEPELRGKTEKDEPRAGLLAGSPEETKKTIDAWKAWWDSRKAKKDIEETRARIAKVHEAILAFKKDQGLYPATLDHLQKKPDTAKTWPKDGYYQGDLKDVWGRLFMYRDRGTGFDFDIVSQGKDGRLWGAGDNADLWNHDKWKEQKKAETKKAMEEAVKVLNQFKADNGRYPEQLVHLVVRPRDYPVNKWPEKGYLVGVPKDAYDNYFKYAVPGTNAEPFDLISYGADGVEGGTEENEDLWNHDKRPQKKEEKKN